jgi:hypothetical protein
VTNSRRAIEKAEDFAGLKLRVIQNPEGTNCQRRTTRSRTITATGASLGIPPASGQRLNVLDELRHVHLHHLANVLQGLRARRAQVTAP